MTVNTAPSFAPVAGTGKLIQPVGTGNDIAYTMALQVDGKIVLAGYSQWAFGSNYDVFSLIRLNTDGTLDLSFDSDGKFLDAISAGPASGKSVIVQTDGKILVAGYSSVGPTPGTGTNFSLLRVNADGSVDEGFGLHGKVVMPVTGSYDVGHSVTVQSDGKIIVAGESSARGGNDYSIIRLNADGSLDTTFGNGGTLIQPVSLGDDHCYSILLQDDGKIVAAGTSRNGAQNSISTIPFAPYLDFSLIRLNADGSLDAGFADGGKLIQTVGVRNDMGNSAALQNDGKILVAGSSQSSTDYDFSLIRVNTDGSLDTGFGSGGKAIVPLGTGDDFGKSVALQSDGKILLTGSSTSGNDADFSIIRLNADGSLDTSFSGDGKLIMSLSSRNDYGVDVTVQSDGKILVAGYSSTIGGYDYSIIRLNLDGSLDTTFNVQPINTLDGVVVYTENGAAVALDSSVAIVDAELAALNAGLGNYQGARLILSRHGSTSDQDIFSARGNLSFSGGDALLSGLNIGTVAHASGQLSITFNSNATQARVNEVLSSLGYANGSDAPPASVQIDWSFSDGNAANSQGTGGALSAAGSTFVNITRLNDAPTGSVGISGILAQGQTLTASQTLSDADGIPESGAGAIRYQWLADGQAINGATGATLVLAQADVGKAIAVQVAYTDGGGTVETAASSTGARVLNVNDAPTGSVTISGMPTLGQTLTAANTLADVDGMGVISYEWQADGVNIDGANGNTLVLAQALVGKTINLAASYTDGGGATEAVLSSATLAVTDFIPPTVQITDNLPGIANRSTNSVTYTLAFSEDVTGLDASDFAITNGAVASIAGSGSHWAVSVAPAEGVATGVIGLTLQAGAVADLSGNVNAVTLNTSQALDTAAPVAPKLVTSASFNSILDPQVTFQTSLGSVVVELNTEQARVTVANLLAYVNTGFYDGMLFHQVVPGLGVQGGGYTTGLVYKTPTYGPIELESNNGLSNLRSTLAMARGSAADSATDQFVVNLADNAYLDYAGAASPGYAVFGKVVAGMEVIDAMAQVPTATVGPFTNVPVSEVTIVSAQQTRVGGIASNTGLFTVSGLEPGAKWFYTVDDGAHWNQGAGTSFAVPVANYPPGAIRVGQTDAAGNNSLLAGAFTSALVVEITRPVVTGFSPADAATGIAVGSDIVLTFNETIERGSGTIVIRTADGTIAASFGASDTTNLTVSGATVTINPPADLAPGTHYVVEIMSGTVMDRAGNAYAGIINYDFDTAGVTGGLTGTRADDQLHGTGGNDTLTPGLGNDSVDGGAGVDTVVLPMFPNVFSLIEPTPGHVSGNYGAGAPYTLVLDGVEFVQFGTTFQTTIPLSVLLSGEAQLQLGRLTDLYLAFFGRAPDVSGLEFWQEKLLENHWSLTALAIEFAWSAEAQAQFPQNSSNRDFVRTVYLNCFGREPDAGGWDYWTGRLNGLGVTDLSDRGAFVGEVLLGAYAPSSGAEDRALLTHRHEAAMYYANQLAVDPAEGFDMAINALLARVTGDPATEDKAEDVIDYAFANPVTLTGVMTDQGLLDLIWGA